MLLAGVLFSFMSLSIRFAVQEVHVLQTVFFRNIVNLLIMLPLFWHIGFEHLRTKRPVIQYSSRPSGTLLSIAAGKCSSKSAGRQLFARSILMVHTWLMSAQ